MIEEMYRYVEEHDYIDEGEFTGTEIRLLVYRVIETTPCGVWVIRSHRYYYLDQKQMGYGMGTIKKWVLTTPGKKRFAYPTKREALEAFVQRKKSHVWHSKHKLKLAESALAKGEAMLSEEKVV